MSQVALLFLIHVLGLALTVAWGPRKDTVVCCALAFPAGVAAAGALALATLYVSAPFVGVIAGGALAIFAAAIWRARGRWRPGRRDLLIIGVGSAVFLGFAILFSLRDATALLGLPAHRIVLIAQTLGADGTSFDPALWAALSESGPLLAAAYGLAEVVDGDYLYALQPVLSVCVIAVVATAGERGGKLLGAPWWARAAAVSCGALALAGLFILHPVVVLVDSSALAVVYVTCFLAVWWLAEIRDDASMTPVALLCLAALFLLSAHGALFGLLLLAIAIFPSTLAGRDLEFRIGVTVAALVAWLAAAAQDFPAGALLFDTGEAQGLLVGLIVLYLVWVIARSSVSVRFVRLLPASLLILAAVVTAAGIVAGAAGLDESAGAAWRTLRDGNWNATWPAILFLAGLGLLAGRMPREGLLAGVIPLHAIAVIWIGRDADPEFFRLPSGELHALAVQAAPVAVLYLLLKLSWLLRQEPEGADEMLDREAPPGADSHRAIGIASVVLLTALLLSNLHHAGFTQKLYSWRYRLGPIEVLSLLDEAHRLKHSRVPYTIANYLLVAERARGGRLLLPRELRSHALHFRYLAGLDVTISKAPLTLPSSAVEQLSPHVDETWQFLVRPRDLREIRFIFEEGTTDWVLATPSSGAPMFWLPLELYRQSGGSL
jgi:hypothetical protein